MGTVASNLVVLTELGPPLAPSLTDLEGLSWLRPGRREESKRLEN